MEKCEYLHVYLRKLCNINFKIHQKSARNFIVSLKHIETFFDGHKYFVFGKQNVIKNQGKWPVCLSCYNFCFKANPSHFVTPDIFNQSEMAFRP